MNLDLIEEEYNLYGNDNLIIFEEDYEDVKTNPNIIWFKYEEKIQKIIRGLSYSKNFDSEELMQESYIYFKSFCQVYDPYYNGNFIPFDKFLFKNLIMSVYFLFWFYYCKINFIFI